MRSRHSVPLDVGRPANHAARYFLAPLTAAGCVATIMIVSLSLETATRISPIILPGSMLPRIGNITAVMMMIVVTMILENIVSTEGQTPIPKGIGNPGVEVIICGRRFVVGDGRWALANVVIGDTRLIRVSNRSARRVTRIS